MGKQIKEIEDLPGIGTQAAEKLMNAGYKTVESIAVASPAELVEAASLGEGTATKAIRAARDSLEMGFESADKLAERRKLIGKITTGSKEFDTMIGGGIETGSITEVYGKYASAKCVAKDTNLFYFNSDKAHLKEIREVYEEYAVNEREYAGGFAADLKRPVKVIAIDKNGNSVQTNASGLYKQFSKELLELETERGAKIKLTEQHPLLTLNEGGIQWKSAGLLKEDEFIGCPAKIDFEGKKGVSNDDAYFLGLFVAEGCANPASSTIFDTKAQEWIISYIQRKFGYVPRFTKEKNLILFKKPTIEFLGELAKCKSGNKFVPEEILTAEEETVKNFLRGYIEGGGYLGKNLEATTKSKKLAEQLSYLFARSNVPVTIRNNWVSEKLFYRLSVSDSKSKKVIDEIMKTSIMKNKKMASEKNISHKYCIPIKGFTAAYKRIYSKISGSRRRFNKWNKKEMIKNYQTLFVSFFGKTPAMKRVTPETIKTMFGFFKTRMAEIKEAEKQLNEPTKENVFLCLGIFPFRTQEIRKALGLKESTFQNYISRHMAKGKAKIIAEKMREMARSLLGDEQLKQDMKLLELLSQDKIKWEKITSLKKIEYNDWVYDLVVPEAHNFVGGNKPVFLHNTQVCFQTAVTVQLPVEKGGLAGGCLWIDSENSFRPERIIAIAEHLELNPEEVLKNILVARAYNADHQSLLAEKTSEMIKEKNIKLLIVDSLTAQFRAEFIGRGQLSDRQQKLNKHMHTLMKLAEMNNVAVLVTNQVMQNPGILFGDPTTPIGGEIVGHACLAPDTLIQAGNGEIKKICDLENASVYGTDFKEIETKARKLSCKSSRGNIKETYFIDAGSQITASANHGFFKLDGFKIKEVKAKGIKKGDYLLQAGQINIENNRQKILKIETNDFFIVNKAGAELIKNSIRTMELMRKEFCKEMPFSTRDLRAYINQGQPVSIQNINSMIGFGIGEEIFEEKNQVFSYRHRPIKMPEELSEELAQVTGYLLGNGNIDKRAIRFRDSRKEVLEKYKGLCKGIFNIEGKIKPVKGKNCWQLGVNIKEITELFEYLKTNAIPIICQSPNSVAKYFIKGFVDAEGHVDKSIRRITIAQKDKQILQIIQLLLLRFSIKSKLKKQGKQELHLLELFSEDVVKYGKEIGASAPDKKKQLEKWVKEFQENRARVIVPIKRKAVAQFLKELFKYPTNAMRSRNYKHITMSELTQILKATKKLETNEAQKEKINLLQAIFDRKITFGKVVGIKKVENGLPLYDISVPETENYIANGFIVHNSKTRIYLRKSKEDKRVAKLVDSPSLPDGEAIFRVTEHGIEDVE